MKILVTGAGGFIGAWLVERLHLRGCEKVRAGIRTWSSAARVGRFPVEIVLCDVLDVAQVDKAIAGMDAVVHCAYGPRNVNVQGTRNLLDASLRHGVRRFVHLSTIEVYGTTEGSINESSPLTHTGSEYGDSKIEAEDACREYGAKGLPVVILRPTVVYGPFASLWVVKFAERITSGNWASFRQYGEGLCNLVYIEDLIDAVLLSLESPRACGEAFNINGPEVITWNEYFSHLGDALGVPRLREISPARSRIRSSMTTPVRLLARYLMKHHSEALTGMYRSSPFMRSLMKRTEGSLKTIPSPDELAVFGRRCAYPIAKAGSLLGYRPAYSVKAGVAMSARWLGHETLHTLEAKC